ncbi:hypothetical protein DFH07DRAFT_841932 [Mycena maculata]|uniref:Uncharacterized protein n=1 Tax=Mycena maculata TaxID=230809 RepID=A0AAD7IAX9_9AGAR|nr:hypothetical protein DFH07DRAFT_841932 [Mycena maculata]
MTRSALYEALPTDANISPRLPRSKRWKRPLWKFGALVAVCALFGLFRMPSIQTRLQKKTSSAPDQHGARKRLYLRVGPLGSEGFGSVLQHFKQSIVLSRALDSTLVLASTDSEHGYSASSIFNRGRDPAELDMDTRKACRIQDHLPHAYRDELVRGLCAGDEEAIEKMHEINVVMADCTSILDTEESETIEDLNGCVMDWVRERLAPPHHIPPSPLSFPPNRALSVGVHIRWGDTADRFESSDGFRGSMALPNIARILADLRAQPETRTHGINLTIAMENVDYDILAQLNETAPYTLLDSGDALADLQALSVDDVLLLGDSSFGVLAHLIAPPGLTVVQLQADHHKYTNTSGFGRRVVSLKDYTLDSLQQGLWVS